MTNKIGERNTEFLLKAMVGIETIEECRNFFEDLCTIQELKEMGQRFYVAKLLSEKRVYNEIVQLTGASTATISRVNRALQYGSGGYRAGFQRAEEHEQL